ncbi:hypothetical protein Pla108_35370 [Botrimarina colliarenosi]|uniref:Uncharacterized protein n=1 Tax=Botrimarina colliarenosi TaxID=2528001 RepID=A0A5C6A7A2_9BACT|nr:hypothetical protein [Botrimarina colliarenosi]TWT95389.1 hypothetical protein Pla108_35370 [Botrimarina colliarenosi]
MVIDLREIADLARRACGNGEVAVVFDDRHEDEDWVWYIAAGRSLHAAHVGLGILELGGQFVGHGATFDEALARVKEDIATRSRCRRRF